MKNMYYLALFIFCIFALNSRSFAQPYLSDWDAAVSGGASPRLQLFALHSQRPVGAGDYVGRLQRQLGLDHPAGAGVRRISHGLTLSPVLDYDSNINGGTPGGYVRLGGLKLTLTDASQAKAGFVAGAALAGNLRLSIAPGRVIEASASGQIARAVDYDLTRRSYALRLCGGQYLGGTNWLDICTGLRGATRALSTSRETHTSVGFTRQYASRHGLHEASAKFERVENGTFAKTSLDFGITHAAARMGVVDWRVEWGQPIAGQHTRLGGVTLSLTRPILGAQSTVFVARAREGGGEFFGTARQDEVFRIGLARKITPRISVTLSAEDRRSTLDNYTGTTFGFNLNIAFAPLMGG